MKPLRVSDKSAHRLLVEGKDDLHTVVHLLRRHDLDYHNPPQGLPYIHATDGYSPLLDALSVAAKSYKRLGVESMPTSLRKPDETKCVTV